VIVVEWIKALSNVTSSTSVVSNSSPLAPSLPQPVVAAAVINVIEALLLSTSPAE